jgi:hypothetical protein
MTSTATSAAAGCEVATIAFWAWTVERPAKWKFLIGKLSFQRFRHPAGVGRGLMKGVLGIFIGGWAMVVCQRFDPRGIPVNAGDTS